MSFIFLDESGDEGNHLDADGNAIRGSSPYLVLGGIIVEQSDVKRLERKVTNIIQKYFKDENITLPANFKLHCTKAKKARSYPYNKIGKHKSRELVAEVYKILNAFDCKFFEVTINIKNHCLRYGANAINPKAYALFICYEMLFSLEKQINREFKIVYEEFRYMQKIIKKEIDKLLKFSTFPNPNSLKDVVSHIQSGKPQHFPILQFADFVANSIFCKHIDKQKPEFKLDSEKFWVTIKGNQMNMSRIIN